MPEFCLDPRPAAWSGTAGVGDDTKDGSQWAVAGGAGPWKTMKNGATAARIAPGDTIKIAKSPDPVNLGNATFTNGSSTITLDASSTKNIDLCEAVWSSDGGANVVMNVNTTYKCQGTNSCSIQVKAAFTTGLAGHHDISGGGALNLSGYTRIGFFIRPSAAVAANAIRVDLSADTTGTDIKDSFTVPQLSSGGYYLLVITKDGGGAMYNGINSVALTVLSDLGASDVTLYIDNIYACNDFNHHSVIGKNDGVWYPIRNINETSVQIGYNTQLPGLGAGAYCGESGLVTAYMRACIPIDFASEATWQAQDSGSLTGGYITYEGGYDPATGNKTGDTFLISQRLDKEYFLFDGKTYNYIKNLHLALGNIFISGGTNGFAPLKIKDCSSIGMPLTGTGSTYDRNGVYWEGTIVCVYQSGTAFSLISCSSNHTGPAHFIFHLGLNVDGLVDVSGSGYYFTGKWEFWGDGAAASTSFSFNGGRGYWREVELHHLDHGFRTNYPMGSDNILIDKVTAYDVTGAGVSFGYPGQGPRIGNLVVGSGSWPSGDHFPGVWNAEPYTGYPIDRLNADDRWIKRMQYGKISDHITGGQLAAWAYGGSGLSMLLNPSSTTNYLPHRFWVPVQDGVASKIHFQVIKTSAGADCSLTCSIMGAGITPIDEESVTLTDSWAEFISSPFTPDFNGFVMVELRAKDGSTTGDIGIDDIHIAAA